MSTPSIRGPLLSLSLTMLLASLGTSIANVGLPTLARAFDAPFQDVQWVVLAYLLAITTLIVSVGRLDDLVGRRRLLLIGLAVFLGASIACGTAPSLWILITARAAQGLGAAIMTALTMAFVGGAVPKNRTGSAMGLLGTMSAIGTALGPSLGGVLIGAMGWRAIFFVNVPLGLLALLLTHRFLPADEIEASRERPAFDLPGTWVLAVTLAFYALAMTLGRGTFGLVNAMLFFLAVLGAGLFVGIERRVKSPLIQLAMFRTPALTAGFVMSALVTAVVMATLVVGPFHLSGALSLDTARVGLVMSAGPIVAALTGVPAGRGVDRFGATSMTIAGLVAMAVGTFALAMGPIQLGAWGYVLPLVVVTAGYAVFQAANNTAVMADLAPLQRGVVSGLLNLSRNLGLITGASVMGAVFAFGASSRAIATAQPEAIVAGTRLTFAVAASLVVIAIFVAITSQMLARRSSLPLHEAEIDRER